MKKIVEEIKLAEKKGKKIVDEANIKSSDKLQQEKINIAQNKEKFLAQIKDKVENFLSDNTEIDQEISKMQQANQKLISKLDHLDEKHVTKMIIEKIMEL
jgi:predicted RNase H-like nuclease (RuvC/YqgF family)